MKKVNELLSKFNIAPHFKPMGDVVMNKILNIRPTKILLANSYKQIAYKPSNYVIVGELNGGHLWQAIGPRKLCEYIGIGLIFSKQKPSQDDYLVIYKKCVTSALPPYGSTYDTSVTISNIYNMFSLYEGPMYTINKYNLFGDRYNNININKNDKWTNINGKYVTLTESSKPWFSNGPNNENISPIKKQNNVKEDKIENFVRDNESSTLPYLSIGLIVAIISIFIIYHYMS